MDSFRSRPIMEATLSSAHCTLLEQNRSCCPLTPCTLIAASARLTQMKSLNNASLPRLQTHEQSRKLLLGVDWKWLGLLSIQREAPGPHASLLYRCADCKSPRFNRGDLRIVGHQDFDPMSLWYKTIEAYHHRVDVMQQDGLVYRDMHEAIDGEAATVSYVCYAHVPGGARRLIFVWARGSNLFGHTRHIRYMSMLIWPWKYIFGNEIIFNYIYMFIERHIHVH